MLYQTGSARLALVLVYIADLTAVLLTLTLHPRGAQFWTLFRNGCCGSYAEEISFPAVSSTKQSEE